MAEQTPSFDAFIASVPPERQAAAKDEYFARYVAPNVAPEDLRAAKDYFDTKAVLPEQPGFFSELYKGTQRGLATQGQGLAGSAALAAQATGDQANIDRANQMVRQQAADMRAYSSPYSNYENVHGLADASRFAGASIGEMAGNVLPTAGIALASGPAAPVTGLASIAATTAGNQYAQALGEADSGTRRNQFLDNQPIDLTQSYQNIDKGKLATGTAASAGLEALGYATGPVGKVLFRGKGAIGKTATDLLAKEGPTASRMANAGIGAVKGGAGEAGTEYLQEYADEYGAGNQDWLSEQTHRQGLQAAASAAIGGGFMGGVGGAYQAPAGSTQTPPPGPSYEDQLRAEGIHPDQGGPAAPDPQEEVAKSKEESLARVQALEAAAPSVFRPKKPGDSPNKLLNFSEFAKHVEDEWKSRAPTLSEDQLGEAYSKAVQEDPALEYSRFTKEFKRQELAKYAEENPKLSGAEVNKLWMDYKDLHRQGIRGFRTAYDWLDQQYADMVEPNNPDFAAYTPVANMPPPTSEGLPPGVGQTNKPVVRNPFTYEGVPTAPLSAASPTLPGASDGQVQSTVQEGQPPADIATQGTIAPTVTSAVPQPRKAPGRGTKIDPETDDLIVAIRRLGGINVDLESDFKGRLSGIETPKIVGLPNIERTNGKGRSLDDLAEVLFENGYLASRDVGELYQRLTEAEQKPQWALGKQDFSQEQADNGTDRWIEQVDQANSGEQLAEVAKQAGADPRFQARIANDPDFKQRWFDAVDNAQSIFEGGQTPSTVQPIPSANRTAQTPVAPVEQDLFAAATPEERAQADTLALAERQKDVQRNLNATQAPQGGGLFDQDNRQTEMDVSPAPAPERVYLSVPFTKKDVAKKAGAKWDADKKLWYAPSVPQGMESGTGPRIPPGLKQFEPDVESVGATKDAAKASAAAFNLSAKTGQPFEVHRFTDARTGITGYYVARPDGTAASQYLEDSFAEGGDTKLGPITQETTNASNTPGSVAGNVSPVVTGAPQIASPMRTAGGTVAGPARGADGGGVTGAVAEGSTGELGQSGAALSGPVPSWTTPEAIARRMGPHPLWEKPAATDRRMGPPRPPWKKPETKVVKNETPDWAQSHADDVGGKVLHHKGDTALVQGFSILNGKPVFVGAKGGSRTRVDIESYTGNLFTPEEKADLIAAKQRWVEADAKAHEENPDGPFKAGEKFAASKSVPKEIQEIVKRWQNMLGLGERIYLTTVDDAKQAEFSGPFAAIPSQGLNPNEFGSKRRLANGDFVIAYRPSAKMAQTLETISHEMGHALMDTRYKEASPEVRKALDAEYEKWLLSTKGKTARELVESLRAYATGKATAVPEGAMADAMSGYWKSHAEWFADQVSRWATTDEKPLGVVAQFFSRLAQALKRFFSVNKRYLASKTMADWLNSLGEANVEPATRAPGEIDTSIQQARSTVEVTKQASQSFTDALKDFWTDKRKTGVNLLLNPHQIAGLNQKYLSAQTYADAAQAMEAQRLHNQRRIAGLVHKLSKLPTAERNATLELMTRSTLTRVNPDVGLNAKVEQEIDGRKVTVSNEHLKDQANGATAHAKMAAEYRALSPEAKKIYSDIRNHFADTWAQRIETVKNLANETDVPASVRNRLNKDMDALKAKVVGPYFPLMREGRFAVVWKSAKLLAAEDSGDQKAIDALKENKEDYWVQFTDSESDAKRLSTEPPEGMAEDAEGYYKIRTVLSREADGASSKFMTALEEALGKKIADTETRSDVLQSVRGVFLETLPELSVMRRTVMRHRVNGVKAEDMMQSIARAGIADAHYLARTTHMGALTDALSNLKKEDAAPRRGQKIDMATSGTPKGGIGRVYEAMLKSFQGDMLRPEPNSLNGMASKLVGLSYIHSLAMDTGNLIANVLQPQMTAAPLMGARFGLGKTEGAMITAFKDAVSAMKFGSGDVNVSKLPDKMGEHQAISTLIDQGMIELSQSRELAMVGRGALKNPMNTAWTRTMAIAGWASHNVETFSRLATTLAAYRLELQRINSDPNYSTKSEQERQAMAVKYASRMSNEALGNYTPGGAPLALRGNHQALTRLALQFKRYAITMLYLYGKTARDAVQGDREAQKTMGLLLGFQFAIGGGLAGLPVALPAQMVAALFPGEDDDESEEEKLDRLALEVAGGDKQLALALRKGPLTALTGIDWGRKMGLQDLMALNISGARELAVDAVAEGRRMVMGKGQVPARGPAKESPAEWTVDNLIPSASSVDRLWHGLQEISNGYLEDGIVTFLPKNMFSSLYTELYKEKTRKIGLTNKSGTTTKLAPEAYSDWDIFAKAISMPLAIESEAWARSEAFNERKQPKADRRADLLERYVVAKKLGEADKVEELKQDIKAFNDSLPDEARKSLRITEADMISRVQSARKADKQTAKSGGVNATKKERKWARSVTSPYNP